MGHLQQQGGAERLVELRVFGVEHDNAAFLLRHAHFRVREQSGVELREHSWMCCASLGLQFPSRCMT